MAHSVSQLAGFLASQGVAAIVEGESDRLVSGVATLEDAQPHEVSFLSNPRYERLLSSTRAAAVVVGRSQVVPPGLTVLRVPDPYEANCRLMVFLHGYRRHPFTGISKQACVDESAIVADNAAIANGVTISRNVHIGSGVVLYPGVYIGENCRLGDQCTLYPNVVVYDGCTLGHRVTVHAGSVIGEDGLGFAPVGETWHKIPQIGAVELGDDVEIGACCTIDRATLGKTVIGAGTKFSNLIAIGHGTKVGPNCMFVAQVGLAGSVTVGRHVTMAGKVGVAGHLSIGDNARLAAMSGVMRDVPENTEVLGQPALEISEARRVISATMRLPDLKDRVRKLEQDLATLRLLVDSDGPD